MLLSLLRTRRGRLAAVFAFVAGVGSGGIMIAAPLAQAATPTVAVGTRVLVHHVIGPSKTVVVPLPVPKGATSVKLVLSGQLAWRPTQLAVCAGTVVTTACRAKPTLTTENGKVTYGKTAVALKGGVRTVAVRSSAASVSVTMWLESYVPAATPTTSPSSSSGSSPSTTPKSTPSASAPAPGATPTPTPVPTTSSAPPPAKAPAPSPSATATPKAPAPSSSPTGSSAPPSTAPAPAGYPSAATTGVPAGTALTVHDGDLVVTTPGTVIDSMEIRGIVRVEAPGVVIQRSKIVGRPITSSLGLVMVTSAADSVTIQDSELYAKDPSPDIRGVIGQNLTLLRVNIHDVTDQVMIDGPNVSIKDSWFHANLHYANDPNFNGGPSHDDNVQISAGKNIVLTHNTFEGAHNAALMVAQDAGVISGVTSKNNSFGGGACSVNLAQKALGPLAGFSFSSNVFQPTQVYKGCAMIVDTTSIGNLAMGTNLWADGTPIGITPR